MTRVAIVILNYNGSKYLKKFLPSVIKYSKIDDCRIIVADNCSKDDSLELLKEEFKKLE